MSKKHTIQHSDGLLPVSVILDGGSPRSENKVFRVTHGISGPLIPRFSVGVEVVDEIDERCRQRTSSVNIKLVRDVRLVTHESVDLVDKEMDNDFTYRTEGRHGFRGVAHWSRSVRRWDG